MNLNGTDKKIIAEFCKGKTLERIARLIGRPGNIERVKEGLKRAEIQEERWYKNEKRKTK